MSILKWTVKTFAIIKDSIWGSGEKIEAVYRWLDKTYYFVRNWGIRISFKAEDSTIDDEDFMIQNFVLVIRIPFKGEIIVDLDCENCWDGLSMNEALVVKKKLDGNFELTNPNNISPIQERASELLGAEIKRRKLGAEYKQQEIKDAIESGRVVRIKGRKIRN